MEIPDQVVETILETQKSLTKTIDQMNQTLTIQLELLKSLLPKPFDYSTDQEVEEEPLDEEVDLFEIVEFEPDEDIEEIISGS